MTTSNTGSQLLAEIAASPEDDTLRLAFADWLDEQPTTRTCPICRGTGEGVKTGAYSWRVCECGGTGTVPDTAADRDRAEFVRLDVERHRRWPDFARVCEADRPTAYADWRDLAAIEKRLLYIGTAHPVWSRCRCPRMADRQWGPSDPRGCSPTCPTCGGTGDLFVSPGVSGASKPRTVTFARGFPDSVTCTLAEAFGTDGTPTSWAVAVVRQTPVTRFVVTDRRPEQDRGDQRPVWFNRGQVSNQTVMESTIPEFVYEEMRGYDNVPCPPHIGKWYPTAESAVTALAIAAGRVVRRAVYGKDGAA